MKVKKEQSVALDGLAKDELAAAAQAQAGEVQPPAPPAQPKADLAAFAEPLTTGLNKLVDIAAAVKEGTASVDQIQAVVRDVINVLNGIVQDRAALPAAPQQKDDTIDDVLARIGQGIATAAAAQVPPAEAGRTAGGADRAAEVVAEMRTALTKAEQRITDLTQQVARLGGTIPAPAGGVDVDARKAVKPDAHSWPDDLGKRRGQDSQPQGK